MAATYNYGPISQKAVKLIAKYGKTVTLGAASQTPADANKPWRGPAAASDVTKTPKGVVASFEKSDIDGDAIKSTDAKLIVAAQDPALAGFDIKTVTYAIVDGSSIGAVYLKSAKPGDTELVYSFRLRQG